MHLRSAFDRVFCNLQVASVQHLFDGLHAIRVARVDQRAAFPQREADPACALGSPFIGQRDLERQAASSNLPVFVDAGGITSTRESRTALPASPD